jgi:hypothetical protein
VGKIYDENSTNLQLKIIFQFLLLSDFLEAYSKKLQILGISSEFLEFSIPWSYIKIPIFYS